jgi:hypothetical protein
MEVLSRGELRRKLEEFNNCSVQRVEGWWMYFRATRFAVEGIRREIGRRTEHVGGDEWRISVSNQGILHK